MLRRTNFGMLVDESFKSEDEKNVEYIVKTAKKYGMEIIEGETALSFGFCKELIKRIEGCGRMAQTHLLVRIENLEERLKKRDWIPVSERPPEESLDSVIGWDAYRERPVFVQYINGHFGNMGSNESFDIKAWMPSPESYKESEDNNDNP